MSEFQVFLRGALKSRGWSVLRLAAEADISDAVIYRWLRPDRPKRPSDGNLKKLAAALGVRERDLLRLTGYLPRDEDDPAVDPDPEFAVIRAAWPRLEEWRRKPIRVLAGSAATLTIVKPVTYAAA